MLNTEAEAVQGHKVLTKKKLGLRDGRAVALSTVEVAADTVALPVLR